LPASSISAKQLPAIIDNISPQQASHGSITNQYHHPLTAIHTNTILPMSIPTLFTKLDVKSHIIINGIKARPVTRTPMTWKIRGVMICHDEREVIVTYVSACGVKASNED